MILVRNRLLGTIMSLLIASIVIFTAACGVPRQLPKGAIGNVGRYNYSPSILESEGKRRFWWCSEGANPADHSQKKTDTIFYQSVNVADNQADGPPILVLAETPGTWDSSFTCNPRVIGGRFHNPLGDGQTYTYAMYYVATASPAGLNNSIGVAFSNDGVSWRKFPHPIIPSSTPDGYGVAQPVLHNDDRKSLVWMFYEDSYPTTHHVAAISTDGVHFSVQGTITSNGLNPDNPEPGWGEMAYEPKEGEWYAIFNRPVRPTTSTGGILERGNYGVELYKIREGSLLAGGSSWQQLTTMDTNTTGFESNFIAAFVHDAYGNLDLVSQNNIRMYTSISYPPPRWEATPEEAGESADQSNWILFPMEWTPSTDPTVPLDRYFNGTVHQVTTGWISPDGKFQLESLLGHLYRNRFQGGLPFYSCKADRTDYFVSLDVACEGHRILGTEGYAYPKDISGRNLVALYRCSTDRDHFVSKDPKCEGHKTDILLGYVLP
jgi:hypothetical protein